MTLWAAVMAHRRSCLSSVSLRGTEGRRGHVSPGVCPAPLQGPAPHTPHGPRIIPALHASTEGTRGRAHCGWGVCARTLRQRPAALRLRKPGIAMTLRPSIHGAYMVWPHVLRHPIRRQSHTHSPTTNVSFGRTSVIGGTGAGHLNSPPVTDGTDVMRCCTLRCEGDPPLVWDCDRDLF